MRRGNCYVTCEAIYHLIGGKQSGYTPMVLRIGKGTHWYLKHSSGLIIDPTKSQFNFEIDYSKGKGCGFLTKKPSRRACKLMDELVWQKDIPK